MKRKTLSLALALCLVFSLFSWCGILSVAEEIIQPDNNEIIQTAELEEDPIPYFRLYEEETDLSEVAYLNTDGTVTKTFYPYPVKYVDNDGKTKDISLDIIESESGYITKENSVITEFGNELSDGIVLSAEDVCIEMTPINESKSVFLSSDKCSLTYTVSNILSYVYSLTYLGFKEDIVVKEYNGQTEYCFNLKTNGLTLTEENGSYFLKDSKGETKAAIGDIIVFTADEKNNTFGRMETETVKENEEYILTIILDDEYLKDVKTTYPIRIDPTIEISYTNNGSGAIEDVTINSLAGSDGTSESGMVGKRANYGVSRLLMRFPGLDLSSIRNEASVTSAYIYMRDLMCESTAMTVYCHTFTGNTWNENTANWSNVNPNSYVTPHAFSNQVSYSNGDSLNPAHWYRFNIASTVRGWLNGDYTQSKGVIFKASDAVENGNTNICKTFATYNRPTHKPYLTVTYTMPLAYIVEDSVNVPVGETYFIEASQYQLEHSSSFRWTSSNPTVATVDAYGNVTGRAPGTATITVAFTTPSHMEYDSCVVYVADIGGIYYLKNVYSEKYAHYNGNYPATGSQVEQKGYNSSYKWTFTYLDDGYYSIKLAGYGTSYYLGVENDSLSNSADIVLKTGTITNGMKWQIIPVDKYKYIIRAKTGEGNNRVLSLTSSGTAEGIDIVQKTYTDNNDFSDEWYIIQEGHIYGSQEYRDCSSMNINCHGYAFMRDDWPCFVDYDNDGILDDRNGDGIVNVNYDFDWDDSWAYEVYSEAINYYDFNQHNIPFSESELEHVSELSKECLEEWMDHYVLAWEEETDFNNNGNNKCLNPNQYRIAFRCAGWTDIFTYHFWYQTDNGTWAHKDGEGESVWLNEDNIDPLDNPGNGWNGEQSTEFYNGTVYIYIITLNEAED